MTQPVRIKINTKSTVTEKPPSINMKKLVKEVFCKCIPCYRLRNKDEKLPLTPRPVELE